MKQYNILRNKKKLLVVGFLAVVLCICISYIAYANLVKNDDQASSSNSQKNKPGESGSKNTKRNAENSNNEEGSSQRNQASEVITSQITPPPTDSSFPVITEHYKISRASDKQFDITLYAISNSPDQYDSYIAQLKQYKQESLDYIKNRFGSYDKFIITWSPPAAETL